MRVARSVPFGVLAAAVLTACSLLPGFGGPSDIDCDPRPIEGTSIRPWFGPATTAATTCAPVVRVAGLDYSPIGGRWLDEDSLVLSEYGAVTHASWPIGEPVAYAMDGVSPEEFLVMETAPEDLSHDENGQYTVLARDSEVPPELCDYTDPADSQYPADDCPLLAGRQYRAEIITGCRLRGPVGPFGGSYWRVVDPPDSLRAVNMALDIDYGTIELLPDGRLRYVAETGAELLLKLIDDPGAANRACRYH